MISFKEHQYKFIHIVRKRYVVAKSKQPKIIEGNKLDNLFMHYFIVWLKMYVQNVQRFSARCAKDFWVVMQIHETGCFKPITSNQPIPNGFLISWRKT